MKANETSREELLLRDVKILFEEMYTLRAMLEEEKQINAGLMADLETLKAKAATKREEREKEDMALKFHARAVFKEKRKKYGLTQKELSAMIFLDISFIEKGYNVSVETLEAALKAMEELEATGQLKAVKPNHYECVPCGEKMMTLSKRPRCKICGERMTNVYEN
ncbi:DNA-binding protein [Bacillus phage Silence]|nr:DNA-binding protein [Bacillus phage Silence]